jgi:hypothetical protein
MGGRHTYDRKAMPGKKKTSHQKFFMSKDKGRRLLYD